MVYCGQLGEMWSRRYSAAASAPSAERGLDKAHVVRASLRYAGVRQRQTHGAATTERDTVGAIASFYAAR